MSVLCLNALLHDFLKQKTHVSHGRNEPNEPRHSLERMLCLLVPPDFSTRPWTAPQPTNIPSQLLRLIALKSSGAPARELINALGITLNPTGCGIQWLECPQLHILVSQQILQKLSQWAFVRS